MAVVVEAEGITLGGEVPPESAEEPVLSANGAAASE